MKKYLIVAILSLIANTFVGQNSALLADKIWEVREYSRDIYGQRYVLYNSDSINNLRNLENKGYEVKTDGNYNALVDGNINASGIWTLNAAQDSLNLDDESFLISLLTQDSLVIKTTTIKYGLETNTFLKLIQNPSLSNDAFVENDVFELFPNPTKGQLNLKFDNTLTLILKEVIIVSLLGKSVMSVPLNNSDLQTISLKNLSNGIYFVKIIDNSNTAIAVKKFIVNK